METVLSGVRPTGKLHLGNYLGAAINFVKMQENYKCFYFIADYHALTTHTKAAMLRDSSLNVLIEYLAIGVDPEKATIYIQSHVPEIAELYLFLNMFAYKGELEKCVTFKEKARKEGQTLNAGLLTYPVLMAADILIHKAHKVPVGDDQMQHLEMTRNFAQRFNHYYETEYFPIPQAFNNGEELLRVPNLDGMGKMSKSDDGKSAIFLVDDEAAILKKIKAAKTDGGPSMPNQIKPIEIENIFFLMKMVSDESTYQFFDEAYNNCSIRYGDMKVQLAKDMNLYVKPFRERILELQSDEAYVRKVARNGAEKARESAQKTIKDVRDLIGLNSLH
jgi:tryptophanyl-tRNA synthetase